MMTHATPFVPTDNPYIGDDRGLFITREVDASDHYCRIGQVEVYNLQGSLNYQVVGYKVYRWAARPVSDKDYSAFTVYKDPRDGADTFWLQTTPKPYTPAFSENLCIHDFITQVRRLEPTARPTLADLTNRFVPFKDNLHPITGTEYAICQVVHRQRMVSSEGKPLPEASCELRYRAYRHVGGQAVEGQVYPATAFIRVEGIAFTDRDSLIQRAKDHFMAGEGMEQMMRLLTITG